MKTKFRKRTLSDSKEKEKMTISSSAADKRLSTQIKPGTSNLKLNRNTSDQYEKKKPFNPSQNFLEIKRISNSFMTSSKKLKQDKISEIVEIEENPKISGYVKSIATERIDKLIASNVLLSREQEIKTTKKNLVIHFSGYILQIQQLRQKDKKKNQIIKQLIEFLKSLEQGHFNNNFLQSEEEASSGNEMEKLMRQIPSLLKKFKNEHRQRRRVSILSLQNNPHIQQQTLKLSQQIQQYKKNLDQKQKKLQFFIEKTLTLKKEKEYLEALVRKTKEEWKCQGYYFQEADQSIQDAQNIISNISKRFEDEINNFEGDVEIRQLLSFLYHMHAKTKSIYETLKMNLQKSIAFLSASMKKLNDKVAVNLHKELIMGKKINLMKDTLSMIQHKLSLSLKLKKKWFQDENSFFKVPQDDFHQLFNWFNQVFEGQQTIIKSLEIKTL